MKKISRVLALLVVAGLFMFLYTVHSVRTRETSEPISTTEISDLFDKQEAGELFSEVGASTARILGWVDSELVKIDPVEQLPRHGSSAWYEQWAADAWIEMGYSPEKIDTALAQWEESRKELFLNAYPLSEEGRIFLGESTLIKAPRFAVDALLSEYGLEGSAFAIQSFKTMVVSESSIVHVLHEFSHIAFYGLVDSTTALDLEKDLLLASLNVASGFEAVSSCLIPDAHDTAEHSLLALIAQVDGNLNLIPPSLRKYTPWLAPGILESLPVDPIRLNGEDQMRAWDFLQLRVSFCPEGGQLLRDGMDFEGVEITSFEEHEYLVHTERIFQEAWDADQRFLP